MRSAASNGRQYRGGRGPILESDGTGVQRRQDEVRGRPSAWWRHGQERRLALISSHMDLAGARVLDLGCGLGAYSLQMAARGARVTGTEVEPDRALDARSAGVAVALAVGEHLPFAAASFDAVLMHEVLEHVADDRATLAEVGRVLAPGGLGIVFVPNRLWPFETHGVVWRGQYRFGNAPLVNYLPDPVRNRLAPHVRTYTRSALRRRLAGLPLREIALRGVFPGFDKLAERSPWGARGLRLALHRLETTPLSLMALSHLWVFEKVPAPADREP